MTINYFLGRIDNVVSGNQIDSWTNRVISHIPLDLRIADADLGEKTFSNWGCLSEHLFDGLDKIQNKFIISLNL
jgi:hypothetical protein